MDSTPGEGAFRRSLSGNRGAVNGVGSGPAPPRPCLNSGFQGAVWSWRPLASDLVATTRSQVARSTPGPSPPPQQPPVAPGPGAKPSGTMPPPNVRQRAGRLGAAGKKRKRLQREAAAAAAARPWSGSAEEEEEEVKISALEMAVKDEPEEDVKIRELEYGGEGGQRRGVKREREEDIVVEAGPSGRGPGGRQQAGHGRRGASRFRGLTKMKGLKVKPWQAQIYVTEDGKHRKIHIGTFAREEDAARAWDRVSIAKVGHAQAETNFPVEQYREE